MSLRLRPAVMGWTAARRLLAVSRIARLVLAPTSVASGSVRSSEHAPHRTLRFSARIAPAPSMRKTYSAHGQSSPHFSHAPPHRRATAARTLGATERPPNMRLPSRSVHHQRHAGGSVDRIAFVLARRHPGPPVPGG